ncbi:MAG: GGDEF domain-containing protein [Clostridia bacterium]|nr:GGDEF domain-containing protein [Clostridia bacterium]
MKAEELKTRFRNQLINVHAFAVIAATLVEIIAYILYTYSGTYPLTIACPYLWHSLIGPAAINFSSHIIARKICKSDEFANDRKNSALIYATLITTTVVSLVHRDFIIAASAFIFPMMLSANFNDRKLLRHSLGVSLFSLTATTIILYAEDKITVANAVNISALYAFAIISFLSGKININFSNRSTEIINSQAMHNSKLEEILQKDAMTGLYNHKMFYAQLEACIKDCHSKDSKFCLAMIDVDNFKSVNDTYGHDNGDKVLINLANVMREFCTQNDIPFRYGGEEFAIIFYEKTSFQTCMIMKKILSAFREMKYNFTDSKITFSCGVVQYDVTYNKDEFFSLADAAMYKAKSLGKNQIYRHIHIPEPTKIVQR